MALVLLEAVCEYFYDSSRDRKRPITMTAPDPPPPIKYDFNTAQGIWKVSWRDDHFFSVGLDRARLHASAVFPTGAVGEVVTIDSTIDGLLEELRDSGIDQDRSEAVREEVCNYVVMNEIPLGVDDLHQLLGCDIDVVRRLVVKQDAAWVNPIRRSG